MIFKVIIYFLYMVFLRIKGVKLFWLRKIKGEEKALEYTYKLYKKWAKFTLKIIGVDISITGIENIPNEPCVFIGNHTSILDIPILMSTINKDLGFISKKEILDAPFIGYWLKAGKNVALDRSNPREGIKAINRGVEYLKDGYSMVIFPEGTRSKTGEIGEFKKGSLKLATKSQCPIVPIYIERASRCFEDERKFKSASIRVVIEKPVYTEKLSKEEEKNLAQEVRCIISKQI